MRKRNLFLLTAILFSLLPGGCRLFSSFLNFSISLVVSKGDYDDHVYLTWSDNFGDDEDEEAITADYFEIYRDGFWLTDTTSTSYEDNGVYNGVIYDYYVTAYSYDGSLGYTNTEQGFAMDSDSLQIYSREGAYYHDVTSSYSGDYDNIAWFDFYAQEGWTYYFKTVINTVPLDTSLWIYKDPDIEDLVVSEDDTGFTDLVWTCRDSGKYYLKVLDDSGSGSFFRLTSWHENP